MGVFVPLLVQPARQCPCNGSSISGTVSARAMGATPSSIIVADMQAMTARDSFAASVGTARIAPDIIVRMPSRALFKTANVLNSAACPLDENAPAVASLRRDRFQHRYFTPPAHPMRT